MRSRTVARPARVSGIGNANGIAALACVVGCVPATVVGQTAGRTAPPESAPQMGAPAVQPDELPGDLLLQLPFSSARPAGPAGDPSLYRSLDRSGGLPTRDEGPLQLSTNAGQEAAVAATARRVSRTVDDLKPRGLPVLTRTRADYDPAGIRISGFTLYPSVTASANATSNVFLQPDNGRADAFGTARADMVARSDFTRHSAVFDGFVEGVGFARSETENGISYLARAAGRLDVAGRDGIVAEVSRERRLLDRFAVGETVATRSPVRFNRTFSEAGGQIVRGRTSLDLRGTVTQVDFEDTRLRSGAPLDYDYRDYTNYGVSALVAYELGYGRAFYAQVTQDWQRARLLSNPRRDLQRTELLAGIRGEITPLLTGQAAIGYLNISFRDPTIRTQRTPAIDIRLNYLYTNLTTFTLTARRSLLNVASFTAPGAIVTTVRLGVDHELYRNVILSAGATYNDANYIRDPQTARVGGADLSAQYLVDRRWRMRVTVAARSRRTRGFDNDRGFDALTTGVGITYQL